MLIGANFHPPSHHYFKTALGTPPSTSQNDYCRIVKEYGEDEPQERALYFHSIPSRKKELKEVKVFHNQQEIASTYSFEMARRMIPDGYLSKHDWYDQSIYDGGFSRNSQGFDPESQEHFCIEQWGINRDDKNSPIKSHFYPDTTLRQDDRYTLGVDIFDVILKGGEYTLHRWDSNPAFQPGALESLQYLWQRTRGGVSIIAKVSEDMQGRMMEWLTVNRFTEQTQIPMHRIHLCADTDEVWKKCVRSGVRNFLTHDPEIVSRLNPTVKRIWEFQISKPENGFRHVTSWEAFREKVHATFQPLFSVED